MNMSKKDELLEWAWGIIANAHGGDWEKASEDWRGAAEKWRDEYHETRPVVTKKSDSHDGE